MILAVNSITSVQEKRWKLVLFLELFEIVLKGDAMYLVACLLKLLYTFC